MSSNLNFLNHPICFTNPRRLTPHSGWHEHIPFAMFLIDILKPNLIVELGTHYGDSYSAFCQAVHELNLATRCYAVDTWKGDPHSSFYGPEVLADLQSHHDKLYGSFSRLIKSNFDEALQNFSEGTIDLLHIDGYHTYEAVKLDFESWLPKMSQHGVILLHDINVREGDFGVWRLWDELKIQYLHFCFLHGNGLGMLVVGKDYPKELQELLEAREDDVIKTRNFFFLLGQRLTLQIKILHLTAEQENIAQETTKIQATVNDQQQALAENEKKLLQATAEREHIAQETTKIQATVNDQQQALAENEKKILQLSEERERLYREASQYQIIAHDQQQALDAFYRNKLLRAYWRIKDKLSFIRKAINLVTWVKSQHLDANNKACFCNVCGWEGKAFIGIRHPESLHCPECGSISRDRMLYEAFLSYLREDCGVNKSFLLDDTHIPYRIIETSPHMNNSNLRNSYKKRMIEICDQYIEIGYNMKSIKASYHEDPQNLTLCDASIDFILSSTVITQVPDDRRAYNEVFRVLKEGGVAFFQMPILNFQTTVAQIKDYYNDNTPVIRRNGWDVVDKMRDAGLDVSILVCDELFLCFESFPSNDFTLFDQVTFNAKYGHRKEYISEYPFVSLIQKDRQMKLAIYPFGAHEVFKCYKQPLIETDE